MIWIEPLVTESGEANTFALVRKQQVQNKIIISIYLRCSKVSTKPDSKQCLKYRLIIYVKTNSWYDRNKQCLNKTIKNEKKLRTKQKGEKYMLRVY